MIAQRSEYNSQRHSSHGEPRQQQKEEQQHQQPQQQQQRKAIIKNADMSETMQQYAIDIAAIALSKYNIEKVRPFVAVSRRTSLLYKALHCHLLFTRNSQPPFTTTLSIFFH